jgi:DNA-binding response OmpR family regulator
MAELILIVDDNPILTALLRAHLLAEGFEVVTADDVESVTTALDTAPPDLILLDVTAPDHAGWELCIHQCERSAASILYITPPGAPPDHPRLARTSESASIAKPFSFEALLKRVQAILLSSGSMFAA